MSATHRNSWRRQPWRLHRHPWLLRGYGLLPHRAMNRVVAAATGAELPRPLLALAIAAWVRRGGIDMSEVEPERYDTLEAFFLRRLRPGTRPIGAGVVSPVDGFVVSAGPIAPDATLDIKGQTLSIDDLVRGRRVGEAGSPGPIASAAEVAALRGGWQLTVFLTPDGYHHVHCPFDATLVEVGWLPGRFFPQNDDALALIDGVYARNERAVLRLRDDAGRDAFLVMVAASLVGGIELEGLERSAFVRARPLAVGRSLRAGDRLGCFRFGSTIVLLLPPGAAQQALPLAPGDPLRLGQTVARRDARHTDAGADAGAPA